MSRLSSIKTLPPEVRSALDSCLAEGNLTLDALVSFLEQHGYTISRSALGRYRKDFEEVAVKLRESREIAAAFARELGAVPGDEMGQLLLEMVHTLTFRVCNSESDGLEPKDVMFLAKTIKDLTESRRISARTALEIRAEEKKRLEEEMKTKLAEASAQGSLAGDAAREARRILGFTDEQG
jgi:hypothetical protein